MRGYTVEMSFLTPIIMLLVMSSIYAFFYYHDKNIIAGAAYETAVVGSNKAREKPDSQTGSGDRSGTDVAELETLFQSRVNGKCILLSTIQGQVTVEIENDTIKSKRGDHHGIGLLNVKAVVDKYGGDMVLSCDENEFKAVVIL